jgi:hypothetical protein
MRREDIRADVIETAKRFGDRNPQEFQRLARLAARIDPTESVQGLLSVFAQPSVGGSTATEQELAGKVLAALPAIPPSNLPLEAFLRSALQNYDRSVEQLPRYLALVHGEQVVQDELARLLEQALSEREKAAAETMAWWLRGRPE